MRNTRTRNTRNLMAYTKNETNMHNLAKFRCPTNALGVAAKLLAIVLATLGAK